MATSKRILDEAMRSVVRGHWAHADANEILAGMSLSEARWRPQWALYSIWQEICHLELCQRDILTAMARSTPGLYETETDLWPDPEGPKRGAVMNEKLQAVLDGLAEAEDWVKRADTTMACPRWEGASVAQGLQVLGSHASYHLGRIALLRGAWKRSKSKPRGR